MTILQILKHKVVVVSTAMIHTILSDANSNCRKRGDKLATGIQNVRAHCDFKGPEPTSTNMHKEENRTSHTHHRSRCTGSVGGFKRTLGAFRQ